MSVFDAIFDILIGEEGGYTNDPNDPGGETNWGIDKKSHPDIDIKNLTKDGAKTIYINSYWLPSCSDKFPSVLAMMVFDAAVNNGVERAKEWLQTSLGVTADGKIGPMTIAALQAAIANPNIGVNGVSSEFLARRIDFMAGLSTWQYFGLGWSRRLAGLPFKALPLSGMSA